MSRTARSSTAWGRPALVVVGVMFVVAAGALGWKLGAGAPVAPGSGRPSVSPTGGAALLPDHPLTALDGSELSLDRLAGRVLVVDFWASWCGPCRLQAEILSLLHDRYADHGVQFVAVNLGEDRATVERYVADHPFPYPVLMDPAERLGVELTIYALPTVLVADAEGRITYLEPGISDRPTLEAELTALGVAGPARPG